MIWDDDGSGTDCGGHDGKCLDNHRVPTNDWVITAIT